MSPALFTFPGFVLCLCGHPQRGHQERKGPCCALVRERRYGKPVCPCLRFTEAPFEQQQLDFFRHAVRDVNVVARL